MDKGRLKVIIAMSGGTDSSVAAALLKKQGYDVSGVFARFWKEAEENICYPGEGEKAALAVAEKLKIPFHVFGLEKEFKRRVVDYFLAQQRLGRTPNPCVVCNKKIKFGLLFKKALGLGADFLATGHYARINSIAIPSAARNLARMGGPEFVTGTRQRSFASLCGAQDDRVLYKLFKAKDVAKDQSYFLYQLNQRQLGKTIFPLGDLTKKEAIGLAKKWRLPCQREQSFDLCFVKESTESFIKRFLKLKNGKILDLLGNVLGEHEGLPLYTIGQRKRLPSGGPWWVVKKDERRNILYISNKDQDLYSKELFVGKINWLSGTAPKLPLKVWAKIRYKSEAAESTLRMTQGKNYLKVIFEKPQRAITPGQSVVFYSQNGEVLGGGEIQN